MTTKQGRGPRRKGTPVSWDIALYEHDDGTETEVPDTWRNYTHNLNATIRAAGLGEWPHVSGWNAGTLAQRLHPVLATLRRDPAMFKALDSPNGWGTYDTLLPVLTDIAAACDANPDATVRMSV